MVNAAIEDAPAFAVDYDALGGPQFFGLSTAPTSPASRINRRSAIQVPAVKRSRDLIAGTLGGLPLDLIGPNKQPSVSQLFEQPEKNVPRSVTFARTFEDLLFEGVAWWQVIEFGWHGYPVKVRRLDTTQVQVTDGKVYVDGKVVPDSDIIKFDSPTDGLLLAGARAIRTCLLLDSAAQRYADEPMPSGFFAPVEGVDPDTTEVQQLLNDWHDARQSRVTGYVPAALKYETVAFSPEQLQMSDARQHAVLEIARVAGIDPEELGVSTTSRTYANQQDRRKAFLDFTLGQYRQAVEDRLSMGDVTPRGYAAKFNLSAFLRSDDLTRMQTYEVAERVGALTREEIRELEDRPALTAAPSGGDDAQGDQSPTALRVVASSDPAAITFDQEIETTTLEADSAATFAVDIEKRTITGLAVPYGRPARSRGQMFQFAKGSLLYSDISRIKLLLNHDFAQAVGYVTALDERDEGLFATFKVARGPEGDRALSLAEDRVLDGLSIGLGTGGRFADRAGVQHAISAPLAEISLTPIPAFDDARVLSVAASADRGETMTSTTEETTEPAGPLDFSSITEALSGAVTGAINEGFANLALPQREAVTSTEVTVTHEPLPYRFDGMPGEHSFVDDMRSAGHGDQEARQRLDEFGDAVFAVSSSDAGTLNPTQNRPELFVGNLQYSRPLWDLVSKGTVADKTPFTVPKFSTATGLVGAHTEGTEPTPGAFTATSQTISPTPLSGKIEINREVLDQGGSPQADAIIWGEMVGAYYEAIEARIATALAAVATAELNLASAVDAPLVDALTNYLAGLQFVRGGNRFTAFAVDGQLFPKLVSAADTTGRKLLPVLGPVNAQGSVTGGFDRVQIGSLTARGAWALGSAVSSKSYVFVPSSVWAWASAPKRFTFEYQVKSVDMAIWGYAATAVLRDSDVKPIDYTAAD